MTLSPIASAAFTVCTNSYLPQAFTLAESLRRHQPDWAFYIGLVDDLSPSAFSGVPQGVEIVPLAALELAGLEAMALRYNIIELCTAVKAFYFEWLLARRPEIERLHYIDPDIAIYHSLRPLDEGLDRHAAQLTPHHLTPIPLDGDFPGENLCLNHGLYNLGYLGLRRGPDATRILAWWRERMAERCVIDLKEGYFVDQLWFNLVPLYFESVAILRHPGANAAFWNLHERTLTGAGEIEFAGDRHPLLFFHFSGYSPQKPLEITRVPVRVGAAQQPALRGLLLDYAAQLQAHGWPVAHTVESVYTVQRNAHLRRQEKRGPWRSLVRAARRSIPEPVKRLLRG